jgi:hypothetical protein
MKTDVFDDATLNCLPVSYPIATSIESPLAGFDGLMEAPYRAA